MKPIATAEIFHDHLQIGCYKHPDDDECWCQYRTRMANATPVRWAQGMVCNWNWWRALSTKEKSETCLSDTGMRLAYEVAQSVLDGTR